MVIRGQHVTLAQLFSGSALFLVLALYAVGVPRVSVGVHCAVDRATHGAQRAFGDVLVSLPPGWCDLGGTPSKKLLLVRVPGTRSSQGAVAAVYSYDFRFDADNPFFGARLGYASPQLGKWAAKDVAETDLDGRPAFEIRYKRVVPRALPTEAVASDFVVPELGIWVSCGPMSAAELAECRALAASIHSRAARGPATESQ